MYKLDCLSYRMGIAVPIYSQTWSAKVKKLVKKDVKDSIRSTGKRISFL